jgi:hypothetical protein
MELENAFVRVIKGSTRQGASVDGTVFRLLGHISKDAFGTFITVDGRGHESTRNGKARIYLEPTGYEMIDSTTGARVVNATDETSSTEDARTDEEIRVELKETFEIVAEMAEATTTGVIKGLIISGPAGIGKSHTVETVMDETIGMQCKLQGLEPKYDIFKGHTSALNLYCMLYRYSSAGSVLVMDDADSALYDEDCLNLLKAVLDTKKVRRVNWGTNTTILEKEGVPSSFEFEGAVIFLTNIKWDNCKSARIANHLQAILSRSHYLDLKVDTLRERVIHMRNVVETTDMLWEYNFNAADIEDLMGYLLENINRLQFVDLRTVLKAADLKRAMPAAWRKRADRTLCKRA